MADASGQVSENERRAKNVLLLKLSVGVFFFFGLHNLLQEAINSRPDFHFGWSLGLLEMVGTMSGSGLERKFSQPKVDAKEAAEKGGWDRGKILDYAVVSGCLMASSSLSSIALNYINFPTKVVFRSCKLIPTMAIAIILHRKVYSAFEWAASSAVCIGLVLIADSDQRTQRGFSPWGVLLVSLSVIADAIMPNVQQRLFARGEPRAEVVYLSNLVVTLTMFVSLGISGDLLGMLRVGLGTPTVGLLMIAYAAVAYIAVSCHMTIVQHFGGVIGVLVGNGRKVMTVGVSFLVFFSEHSDRKLFRTPTRRQS